MVKRRSLDDALTPEEQSFLANGKQVKTPAKPKAKAKSKATPRKEEPPMARPALKTEPVSQRAFQAASAGFNPQHSMSGVGSLNTRISAEILTALLTASMQRKIQRQHPFTQQDIVSEALAAWLKAGGYLK